MDGAIGIPSDRRACAVYGFEVSVEGINAGSGIEQIDIALQPLPHRTFVLPDGSAKTVVANVLADTTRLRLVPGTTNVFKSGVIKHVGNDLDQWLKCYRQGIGGAWQLTFPFVEMQQLNLSALSAIKISIDYFYKPALVPGSSGFNPSEQFSGASNPSDVWSYGYSETLGSQFVRYQDNDKRGDEGFDWWRANIADTLVPAIVRNSASGKLVFSTIELGSRELALHPGPNNEFCILRFTAPSSGAYQIKGYFSGRDVQGTTTNVYILAGQNKLLSNQVNGFGDSSNVFFDTNVSLNVGNVLDFVVGSGSNNNFSNDTTLLSVQIFPT
jgi:hypothetical protein